MSEHPVQIVISDDCSRSRASVFFRAILSIPHFIWLLLWSAVALLAAIANWLATLVRGRSPRSLHRFLAAYVKYVTQFYAYLHLAADPYPSFDAPDGYPIDLKIAPAARQSRWTVALRGLLLLPAALIAAALIGDPAGGFNSGRGSFSYGFGILPIVALLGWFAIMARRSMPRGLRDAAAYALAYGAQFWAYALLLTDRYPDSDPQALPGLPVREDPISVRARGRAAAQPPDRVLQAAAGIAAPAVAVAVDAAGAARGARQLDRDAARRALAAAAARLPRRLPALCDPRVRVPVPDRQPVPRVRRRRRQLPTRSARRRAPAPEPLEDRLSPRSS